MCKRLILTGHYYQALVKTGVHLVSQAIDHVEPRGVVTADGTLHELDLLVLATGFDARAYVRPMEIVGEHEADYAMWWINQIRDGSVVAAAPTEAATKDYNESMKAAMPQTVWVTGCKSWYLGKDGLPELFPWTPRRHRELLATPQTDDFVIRTA